MSDNKFVQVKTLRTTLSQVKTEVDSDIASAISESASTLTSAIGSGDTTTLNNAKLYADGLKTTLDTTIANNLATAKGYTDGAKTALETNISNHTGNTSNPHSVTYSQVGAAAAVHSHTESDITDLGNYATSADLNSYGVSNLSFDNSTSVLTITMKDNSTKTTTITGTGGSGSSSVTLQDLGGASATDLTNHINDTTNPHSVTYTQTGAAAASHTHVEADITDLGSYANSSHTHTVSDITDFGSYASSSHTHTESDITNLGDYATNTNLNSYGVKSISFDNSTGVLTLTMKDDTTKTVTIQVASGSSSSGSGSGDTPSGTGVSISSAIYNTESKSIIFTMSDSSTINCDLLNLIRSIVNNDKDLTIIPIEYNSEWVDRMTGSGTELDPYLIYTPKDFMNINNDMFDYDGMMSNLDFKVYYKLMNNLDFSELCGLSVETNDDNNSFAITTINSSAPLYNNGEGYRPIGYDGYYPLNGSDKSTTLFSEITNIGSTSAIYGTSNTSRYYIFCSELDGNDKVIKGIVSSPANTYSVGLFSFLGNGASIHNLTIKESVFIVNDVYNASNKNSGVGTLTGDITYVTDDTNNRVNIYNVYSYATLISNRSTSGFGSIAGIYGRFHSDNSPGCLVNQCSFRGKFMVINPTVSHHVCGIGAYNNWGDSTNRITNCINTATLKNGLAYTQGIGQNLGKVNINCGLIKKYGGEAYSLSGHANTGYVNGKQFTIRDNLQLDTRTSESNNNSYNYYFKTITAIKSQTFIDEANSLSDAPAFIVNDLDFDNGWPLLIDEYARLEKHINKASEKTNKNELIYEPNAINLSPGYNNDWEDQITGSGTDNDPYLIYTPKDFSMIGRTEDYGLDKYYKLMNNIDFTGLCGIDISVNKENNSYSIKTTNSSAPLYHNGEGFYPIGYNGYYPTPYVTDSNHPDGYYTPGGDPGPITWEEINEIEEWNSSPTTSNIRGSLSSNNYLLYCFTGKFDGNSKIIKGIRCAPKSTFSVGLFMFLSKDAYIHNLIILDSIFILPTVWHQWPSNTNRDYYLGAIAGDICKGNISSAYTVNLYRVYSYATLVNDVQINSSYQGSFTGGLIGCNGNQSTIKFRIEECTNRGTIIRTNALDNHVISGIITSLNHSSSQMIVNCINSSSFTAKWALGAGYAYFDKININFGIINTYASNINYTTLMAIGGESERTSDAQCYFNEGTPYVFYYSNCPRFYAKSEQFLKSQEFIDEANGYNGTPLLVYNDLGVDNDWPLLIDEYDIIKNFFDNLVIAGFDLETNKLYRSNFPIKNICEKNHTHTSSDISDKDIAFAVKNHTHALADITDVGIINTENGIQYADLSSTNYNNSWEDLMTGTGTELDPYLIYTPKDFMNINDDMTAHYKLMNNLDFSAVTGMRIEVSGNSYQTVTIDSSAPLYNNGEGFYPIGYNGYYPLNDANGVMNSTQHYSDFSSNNKPYVIANASSSRNYETIYKYGFFGELDGNHKTIKGIACAPTDTYSVGLFHFLGTGSYIHDLTVKDSVFILSGNLQPTSGYSAIGSIAGYVIPTNTTTTFTINNVYTYATLINHETINSYTYTNGICGPTAYGSTTRYSINQCANHSTFVLVVPDVPHYTCGIYFHDSNSGSGTINNCINTSSFNGKYSNGIGYKVGKLNINCGTLIGSSGTRPIVSQTSGGPTDGKQFANRSMESYDMYSNETQANSYNIYYKTTAELKSQEFIDEANALLPEPVFIYNDLNINDGWPLLIDEYNSIVGVNGDLNVSLIDPIANKVYKSGFSLNRLQKVLTHNEVFYEFDRLRDLIDDLQAQLTDNVGRIYPLIQRNITYSVGDKVTLSNIKDKYLECVIAGTTDTNSNIYKTDYLKYNLLNNSIVNAGTSTSIDSTTIDIGSFFKDGTVYWRVCDVTDNHLVGEIILTLNTIMNNEYFSLASTTTYTNDLYKLYIDTIDSSTKMTYMDLKGIRLMRNYFNNNLWISNIDNGNQLNGDLSDDEIILETDDDYNNYPLYGITLHTFTYDDGISNSLLAYNSDSNLKYLMYFAVCELIKNSLNNPLNPLQILESIESSDITAYNNHFSLSITDSTYLDFTNLLINEFKRTDAGDTSPTLTVNIKNLKDNFIKFSNASGVLQKAGLPNITGSIKLNAFGSDGGFIFPKDSNGALKTFDNSAGQNISATFSNNNDTRNKGISFDASESNSIYGNSTTVTPQNISLIPYIKL